VKFFTKLLTGFKERWVMSLWISEDF
jgi:hypothetical protein